MSDRIDNIAEARRNLRASACPGLFRIVPARDGGICRLKLPLGQLSAAQARAVALAASRFGTGVIDVTNRANLQLRGIAADGEMALIDALLDAGLGPNDFQSDDIRNVMVSPTAGIDLAQSMDVLPLARDLLGRLERDSVFTALSPKFSFLIDGGGGVADVDHHHDIRLAAVDGDTMALGFAGTLSADAFAICRADDAVDIAVTATRLFIDLATPTIARLRDIPFEKFRDRLTALLGPRIATAGTWRRRAPIPFGHLGVQEQRQAGLCFVGAAPPLGRLSPTMLSALADVAMAEGDGTIRLTPWQTVIVPNVTEARAADAAQALSRAGFTVEPRQPLAAMVACSGITGCPLGKADTKGDGLMLARRLGAKPGSHRIHLTACAKSCASPRVADVTLLALAPGRYELFVKTPNTDTKFGRSVARDLDVSEAAAQLDAFFAAEARR